ncbi:TIGR03936 family radical SAM-associated protein [Corynebacterium sp.]|uniref:TIGR03936 family radical SAM-associated protein n=1 Tax=Corynebacterium sp. TaxID=1720 RepID=UPI0026DCE3F8|nr:TIGR03936 family radical SAM-associated protein [Corynebacterium sp.]MDO5032533.1 TIGR03936 family radical SAM-associated protein [Corynebacterium sp.]
MSATSEPTLFRLRVAYPKLGRLKYLGHLELIHTVEQIVRRAHLPYAVTQGFSPHMRIAYTSALPVGTSSAAEYFDVHLTELVPAPEALARLQAASPADLRPLAAAYVELRRPALTAEINRVSYLVELTFAVGHAVDDEALERVFAAWLDAGAEIPYRRGKKHKTLAVAQLLCVQRHLVMPDGRAWIELETSCDNEGSLRPEILIAALDQALRGCDPGVDEEIVSTGIQQLTAIAGYQVERICQGIAAEGAPAVPPLEVALEAPVGSLAARARGEALSNL